MVELKRILVPLDFVETTQRTLPQHFLDDLERGLRARLEALLDPSDRVKYDVRLDLEVGDPLINIVEYARARSIDLIVMGTHGRTGMAHLFLGSVAERVVRTAPCPVLTVR